MSQLYGYVRVSTREQNEARQIIALHQFCVPDERIYLDKQSGKDFNRPQYRKLMRRLRPGDVLALCGKGHEDYQVIDGVTLYLDEHRIVREWLERKGLNKA